MKQLELQASVTKTASYAGTDYVFDREMQEIVVTLAVTAHDRTTGDETTNFYITTGDGVSSWDIVSFPQIATTGAKTYTARVNTRLLGQNVTSAVPGVAANDPAIFKTDTAAADQGIKTLTAGMVRHGPIGNRIGYQAVLAGTTPSTTYSITVSMR